MLVEVHRRDRNVIKETIIVRVANVSTIYILGTKPSKLMVVWFVSVV